MKKSRPNEFQIGDLIIRCEDSASYIDYAVVIALPGATYDYFLLLDSSFKIIDIKMSLSYYVYECD